MANAIMINPLGGGGGFDIAPYITNVSFQNVDFGGMEHLELNLPKLGAYSSSSQNTATRMFYAAKGVKHITVNSPYRILNTSNMFYTGQNPQERQLKRITLSNEINRITNAQSMFSYRKGLETIDGIIFDLSSITNANSMPSFIENEKLKDVRFKENTCKYNISFSDSPLLTDDTILSIANSLRESVTGQTLTLHVDVKAKLSTMLGTVSLDETETFHIFTLSENGDTTLQNFITNTKGWTLE